MSSTTGLSGENGLTCFSMFLGPQLLGFLLRRHDSHLKEGGRGGGSHKTRLYGREIASPCPGAMG